MAQAVQDIFRGVQVAIGPSIEDGFYYDFEYAETFTPEDLEKIENRMHEIAAANHPFSRQDVPREEAVALFKGRGESYKVELLERSAGRCQNGQPLQAGRLPGSVPGPARSRNRYDQSLQTAERGRRLLAGRRKEQDAAAHIRDGFRHTRAADRVSAHSSKRQKSGITAGWAGNWTFSR